MVIICQIEWGFFLDKFIANYLIIEVDRHNQRDFFCKGIDNILRNDK